MWCNKCHGGSENCAFFSEGMVAVMIPIDDRGTCEAVMMEHYKCPQCGLVSHEHHFTTPFPKKPRSIHPGKQSAFGRTKNRKRHGDEEEESGEDIHTGVKEIVSGTVQAMDYSKLG